MARLWMRRVGQALYPVDDDALEVFEGIARGKDLFVETHMPRNPVAHRRYFALCALIARYLDRDDIDTETVDYFFRLKTGHHYPPYTDKGGVVSVRPKSIAFHNMDETAFRVFFEKCVRFAYGEWQIPNEVLAPLLAPDRDRSR